MSNVPQAVNTDLDVDLGADDEISLLDLLTVVGENKFTLLLVPFLFSCFAAGISFVITPMYDAKVVFVNSSKPSSSSSSQLLESLGGGLGASVAGALGPNSGDSLVALLQSNAVRDPLIDKFDLVSYYKSKNLEEARLSFSKDVKVSADKKSALITVMMKHEDPQIAAQIANTHLIYLRNLQKKLSKEEAQQRRDYFEQQIEVISQKPFRDPFIQTGLMNSLIRQYESARMDESRESLVLQTVDTATAPIKRVSPKRAIMVLITGAATFFITLLWVFIRQALRNTSANPAEATRLAQLKSAWRIFKK